MSEETLSTASARAATRELRVVDLGRRGYREILDLQRRLARERRAAPGDHDVLLLVEHLPVITLGRGSSLDHVIASDDWLRTRGIDVVEIERGGDVTYHGPGQLVGYPILDLHAYRLDLHWYLRRLEETLLHVLVACGLSGYRVEGYTGVWTGFAPVHAVKQVESDGFGTISGSEAEGIIRDRRIRKVGSIGVHASRWITRHGFALNVTAEPLDNFPGIVPCGIDGVEMTSLDREGAAVTIADARELVLRGFNAAFPTVRPRRCSESRLERVAPRFSRA